MYNKLNITENTLQIISLFTNSFDRDYYVREAGKLLNISQRTAQLIMEHLENKGVIESKMRGRIKSYTLKTNELSKRYLILTEEYKLITFMEQNLLVKEIIEKIHPLVDGIGIIFGSYAKGTHNKESDLDIFIAGKYNADEVMRISRTLGIEISVKCYPLKIFERNINQDFLLKEIMMSHIVFANAELFVQKVLK